MDFSEETALKLIDNAIKRRRQEGGKQQRKRLMSYLNALSVLVKLNLR